MFVHPAVGFQRVSGNNQGNPVNAPGTSITTGASNADGSWTQLTFTELNPSGSAAALRHDVHLIELTVSNNFATTVDSSTAIEIGVDYAGGTSYTSIISGILAGFIGNATMTSGSGGGRAYYLPLWIPAGASVAVRGRNVTGSTRTVLVTMTVYGDPRHPDRWWCGQACDSLGYAAASSGGTAIPPSATANTLGSWTNMGATSTYDYQAVSLSMQGATGGDVHVNAAYGVEFGYDSNQIGQRLYFGMAVAETCSHFLGLPMFMRNVPNGAQMQLRSITSATSGPSPQFVIHAFR
jgi:hypothetical protein